MYGLVNKGIRDLVVQTRGEAAWEAVLERAELDVDFFSSNSPYPDALTERLARAAADELGATVDEVLEAFGEHWILYTAEQGYGPLIDASGDSVESFLRNLPNLHTRIKLTHPQLQPPSFTVERAPDGTLLVDYRSHRAGLQHFVVGLLRGLARRFDEEAHIEMVQRTPAAGSWWRFRILPAVVGG